MELTQERLKELLNYDPDSGLFTWLKPKKRVSPGAVVGTICNGYVVVRIDGKRHYAHRLAFLYMTGRWPSEVDHANLNKADNRWGNLREASRRENLANTRARGKSGLKGVVSHRGRWKAQIRVNGTQKNLGSFDTAEQAHEAYVEAAKEQFGLFARAS